MKNTLWENQKTTNKEKMNEDELKQRTKEFEHRCVKLALSLPESILGNHIKGQLIRCSTSVASNYRATNVAQSKASFIAKLGIVVEESDESCFWLEFIIDEKLMDRKRVEKLFNLIYSPALDFE